MIPREQDFIKYISIKKRKFEPLSKYTGNECDYSVNDTTIFKDEKFILQLSGGANGRGKSVYRKKRRSSGCEVVTV